MVWVPYHTRKIAAVNLSVPELSSRYAIFIIYMLCLASVVLEVPELFIQPFILESSIFFPSITYHSHDLRRRFAVVCDHLPFVGFPTPMLRRWRRYSSAHDLLSAASHWLSSEEHTSHHWLLEMWARKRRRWGVNRSPHWTVDSDCSKMNGKQNNETARFWWLPFLLFKCLRIFRWFTDLD